MPSTTPPAPRSLGKPLQSVPCYDGDGIADAFAAAGAPPPFVMWRPHAEMVECRSTTAFHMACDRLTGGQDAISEDQLDLSCFGAMKDWLAIVELAEDGHAYRYAHFGQGITRFYGRDMTKRTTADFPAHISKFYTEIFGEVRRRKERVLTVHQPPDRVFITTWRRLLVPVVDTAGNVTQILTSNNPENELRAGLEILPASVLIVDADHVVRYANKIARQSFDAGNYGPWSRTMFDYAALDLQIRERPEDILAHGITQTCTCRHIKHQRIGQYHATVSAARYKGTAFYIVLLQPQD
ncbi:hypothetical protein [Sedimentitalea todarodis]|uniref:PAS domain-containing protein n=1 Tax=Sedimentitalea todarodis TaxID=1631240 RepID=A0ABU3VAV9_9RHOB|nr:hypothetical protein [Sedimentitalea todarodis]MDU9003315.1 hypothetical protein [Sedimentitalea todarodis]